MTAYLLPPIAALLSPVSMNTVSHDALTPRGAQCVLTVKKKKNVVAYYYYQGDAMIVLYRSTGLHCAWIAMKYAYALRACQPVIRIDDGCCFLSYCAAQLYRRVSSTVVLIPTVRRLAWESSVVSSL